MKTLQPLSMLVFGLSLLYVSVGIFAWHSVENRQKARQLAQNEQGQRDLSQVQRMVTEHIDKKQTQLSVITKLIQIDEQSVRSLVDNTSMLNHVLVIDNNRLSYPIDKPENPLSEEEKQFVIAMKPLIDDPSLLVQSSLQNEDKSLSYGWFIGTHQQQSTLLYWQEKTDKKMIIYALSYTLFRAEIIGELDGLGLIGALQILDEGQLLVQEGKWQEKQPMVTSDFAYPLAQWSGRYQPAQIRDDIFVRFAPLFAATSLLLVLTWLGIANYCVMRDRVQLATRQVLFVGQVSHELRTPLTNVNLYTQLLSERNYDDEKTVRYLGVIEQESARLTRLIQNVLDFTNTSTAHLAPVAVVELINHIDELFTPSFQAKEIAIKVVIDKEITVDTSVYSDRDKLTQIIGNLMSNAEKYASQGKQVVLTATHERDYIVISVRDYGQGVTKQALKKLFKPFYRVHNHLTEGVSGTGIGLTICQQLAESIGATIRAESCDVGLQFSIHLPTTKKQIKNNTKQKIQRS